MITCDRCRQGFDFVSFIGGVALCKGCVKAYDTDLLRCRTKGTMSVSPGGSGVRSSNVLLELGNHLSANKERDACLSPLRSILCSAWCQPERREQSALSLACPSSRSECAPRIL